MSLDHKTGYLRSKRSLRLWVPVVIAVAILVGWIALRHRPRTNTRSAIPDLSLTSPLNLPGGGAAPDDVYAIYSDLYQVPVDEPLVFAEDSVTDIPQVNGNCLQPSTAEEREMVDAFVAANRHSQRWDRKFAIATNYQLLTRGDALAAQTCLETHFRDLIRCARFKTIRHVRFLGVPGFNREHTRALVSIVRMCGRYCGSGGIFAVEKSNSQWRRSEMTDLTSECNWMYYQ